jgi:hypothetical protein
MVRFDRKWFEEIENDFVSKIDKTDELVGPKQVDGLKMIL